MITKWKSQSKYVDIETGETLTKIEVKENYTIIKTQKKTEIYETIGSVEYTNECRRNKQLKLF